MRGRPTQALTRFRDFRQANLYVILAVLFIVVIAAGYVAFYVSTIDPALTQRNQVATELDQARKVLLNARSVQAESVEVWQTRVAGARATVTVSMSAFLTSDQAAKMIDLLYQYARASRVTIVDLQMPPTPLPTPSWTPTRLLTPLPTSTVLTRPAIPQSSQAQPTPTRPAPPSVAPPQPTAIQPAAMPYYVRSLRLRAQGTTRQLVDFASRLQEANMKGVVVGSFNIIGSEGTPTALLSMDLSLYVMPGLSDAVPTAVPTIIPVLPPAPSPVPSPLPPPIIPTVTPSATQWVATATPTLTPTSTPTPTLTPKYIVHIVQPGDTLFSLARRYGTSVEAIMALNGLPNPNVLRVGQQLLIPVP